MGKETTKGVKGKIHYKHIFLVLGILLLLIVLLNYEKLAPKNMLEWFSSTSHSTDGGYPYYLSNNSAVDLQADQDKLILLTDSSLVFLNDSADEVFRSQHNYSSPNMTSSNGRVLMYDRGGKDYKIVSASKVIHTGKTEESISLGAMGENGSFVLVTSSNKGSSKLDIFDKHHKQQLYWTTANEYIMKVALNQKGNMAVVSTISAVETKLRSTLYILDLEKGEAVATFPFDETMIVDFVYYPNGSVTVITDDFTTHISKEMVRLDDLSYQGNTLVRYSISTNGGIALLLKEFDTGDSRVLLVNEEGKQAGDLSVNKTVKWLDYYNGKVSLLTTDGYICYDKELKPSYEAAAPNSAFRMLVLKKYAYLLSVSEISQYSLS